MGSNYEQLHNYVSGNRDSLLLAAKLCNSDHHGATVGIPNGFSYRAHWCRPNSVYFGCKSIRFPLVYGEFSGRLRFTRWHGLDHLAAATDVTSHAATVVVIKCSNDPRDAQWYIRSPAASDADDVGRVTNRLSIASDCGGRKLHFISESIAAANDSVHSEYYAGLTVAWLSSEQPAILGSSNQCLDRRFDARRHCISSSKPAIGCKHAP